MSAYRDYAAYQQDFDVDCNGKYKFPEKPKETRFSTQDYAKHNIGFANVKGAGQTRPLKLTYTFVKPGERGMEPEPGDLDKSLTSFSQVCTYPDKDGFYCVRRYLSNSQDEFVSVKDYRLNKEKINEFVRVAKKNTYRMYGTNTFRVISPPTLHDIYVAKSGMFKSDSTYTGFAPVNF